MNKRQTQQTVSLVIKKPGIAQGAYQAACGYPGLFSFSDSVFKTVSRHAADWNPKLFLKLRRRQALLLASNTDGWAGTAPFRTIFP